MGEDLIHTNRIQREFLFNDAIQSQDLVPASSHLRQKANFLKRDLPSLCAVKREACLSLRAADTEDCCKTPLSIVSLRTLWRGVGVGDCAAEKLGDGGRPHTHKPNPKGIFIQCRHSDTRTIFEPTQSPQITNFRPTQVSAANHEEQTHDNPHAAEFLR
jgi:hypothetical protein